MVGPTGSNDTESAHIGITVNTCGKRINCMIDDGSQVTVISNSFYQSIPQNKRPVARPISTKLITADGSPLKQYGEVDLSFKIGRTVFTERAIITDTTNDMMIGLDFLRQNHRCAISYYNNTLEIDGKTFRTETVGSARTAVCKVTLVEGDIIPPRTEVIVQGKVHHKGDIPTQGMLESAWKSNAMHGLWAGRAIVNLENNQVPIVYRNPTEEPVQVRKGQVAGLYHPGVNILAEIPKTEVCATHTEGPPSDEINPPKETQPSNADELPEHMQNMWEQGSKYLTPEQSLELKNVLLKYEHLFVGPNTKPSVTDKVEHKIDTGDHPPIKQRARRLPIHKRPEAEKEIDNMLQDEVIRPSESPWASPIVLVTKKDGTIRFCIDFRKINDITKKDNFPLPRTDECIDTLAGSKWFCSFDLNKAYWQVPIAEEDKPKTAFADRSGLYEFNVMPMGLCNSAPTFERLMNTVLVGLQWYECLVFLDDILVFGSTFGQALERMVHLFERLDDAQLQMKPKKCMLFQPEIVFLGHVVSENGVKPDPSKTEAIRNWPTPKNAKEALGFVQLCAYYRRFVKDFAAKAKPLYQVDKKNFQWTEACERSFQTLKDELCSEQLLAYPDLNQEFILDTDASQWAVGATLSQVIDGKERPVAFGSRVLSQTERRYSTTKRELLAVKHFLKHYHHYLWGSKQFKIRVDHKPLLGLLHKEDATADAAMLRWRDFINSYDGKNIMYREGKKHGNADSLSRIPETEPEKVELPDVEISALSAPGIQDNAGAQSAKIQRSSDATRKQRRAPGNVSPNSDTGTFQTRTAADLSKAQHEDPDIGPIMEQWKKSHTEPKWENISAKSRATKEIWSQWDQLEERDGVLYRRFVDTVTGKDRLQLIVPKSEREQMLKQHHNVRTGGHLGINKTLARMRQKNYWPGMRRDVQNWIKGCNTCAKCKKPPKRPKAELNQYVVGSPMERVAIDLLKLPETLKGNKYCLVTSCYFTKWVAAFPIPDKEAETVATTLFERYFSYLGMPQELHSDQGKEFEARLFQELCELLDVTKTRTTANNPKSDGLVERFNRTLCNMIRSFTEEYPDSWDDYLPQLMMGYRSTIQESTGMTPNYLMFGREHNLPVDVMYGLPPGEKPVETTAWARELRHRFDIAYEHVRKNIEASQVRQKKLYDQRSWGNEYNQGDLVWLSPLSRGKLDPFFQGPYIVLDKLSRARYVIQLNLKGDRKVVHYDRLFPYKAATIPIWIQDVQNGTPDQQNVQPNPPGTVSSPARSVSSEEEEEEESEEEGQAPALPTHTRSGRVSNRPRWMLQYHCGT